MKKRYLIMLIIAIVLVLFIGAGFAFAYFFTDAFKSNKTLFFKYISQNNEAFNFIKDDDIQAYSEKQKQTPYTSEGTIKTNVTFPDSSKVQIANALQNCNISFSGKVDNTNKYFKENIKANYSDNQSLEFDLYRKNDIYAIKISDVLYKYLGIDNNNIKELAKKLELPEEIISSIPNQLDLSILENSLNIYSGEDISSIKDKYLKIITDNLTDDLFSKEKTSEETIYSITLNETQIQTILVKLLESLKDDEIIINKAKESLINNYNLTEETINPYVDSYKKEIQNLIDMLKYSETPTDSNTIENFDNSINEATENNIVSSENSQNKEETNLTIKVHSQNHKLTKTDFILGDEGSLIISKSDDGVKAQILQDKNEIFSTFIQKIKSPNETKYELVFSVNNNQFFDLTVGYSGLDTNSVHENSELSFEIDLDNSSISDAKTKFVSNYKNTKTFEEIQKEELPNTEIQLLNNAPSKEIIENLFKNIGTKIDNLNSTKLQSLGLANSQNPFLYYIPSIIPVYANYGMLNKNLMLYSAIPVGVVSLSSGVMIYNNAKEMIDSNNQLSKQEINDYNKQFEAYSGKNKSNNEVKALYAMIIAHNSLEKSYNTNRIININGEIPTSTPKKYDKEKNKNNKYTIQLEYDINGYVNNIIIN